MKRLAPAIGFILQAATLSSVLYGLLAWRFENPWFLFPLLFFGTLSFGVVGAWLYYDVVGMRHAEQDARFDMEPQYVEVLSPQMAWLVGVQARALKGDMSAIEEMERASTCQRIQALMPKSVQQALSTQDGSGDLPEEDGQETRHEHQPRMAPNPRPDATRPRTSKLLPQVPNGEEML